MARILEYTMKRSTWPLDFVAALSHEASRISGREARILVDSGADINLVGSWIRLANNGTAARLNAAEEIQAATSVDLYHPELGTINTWLMTDHTGMDEKLGFDILLGTPALSKLCLVSEKGKAKLSQAGIHVVGDPLLKRDLQPNGHASLKDGILMTQSFEQISDTLHVLIDPGAQVSVFRPDLNTGALDVSTTDQYGFPICKQAVVQLGGLRLEIPFAQKRWRSGPDPKHPDLLLGRPELENFQFKYDGLGRSFELREVS